MHSRGIKRLRDLTNGLLELSRVEKFPKRSINLVKLIDEEIDALQPIASEKGVELVFEHSEKKVSVKGSRDHLGRAVMNLIENGIKYSRKDIDSYVKVVLQQQPDGSVKISVRDNGVGVPKKHRKKIFNRFCRVDESRNSSTGGFGLGLPITKKIIDMHGGSIRYVARKDGSEFVIEM